MGAMSMQAGTATPVPTSERHPILDALRGWALLGILVANMLVFQGGYFLSDAQARLLPGAALDDPVELLIEWLVVGKFYSLFSLLFGIGFALQIQRLEARGEGMGRYVRRLAILFLFGLAHLLLLWLGDILALYALMGGVLLLFRRAGDRALLRWAILLWLLPVGWSVLIHFAGIDLSAPLFGTAFATMARMTGLPPAQLPIALFEHPDPLMHLRFHLGGLLFRIADLTYQLRPAKVLAMFLIGLWIGRHALYARLDESRPLLLRTAKLGLGIGLPLALVRALLTMTGDSEAMRFAAELFYCISTPVLALGYAAAFALLWQRGRRKLLASPAPAGRMALTNYLGQSVLQSLIFYGFGLNLVAKLGLVFVIPISLALFAFQVAFSGWWLARFRFGPLEWLWRSATYGRAQPMRLAEGQPRIA